MKHKCLLNDIWFPQVHKIGSWANTVYLYEAIQCAASEEVWNDFLTVFRFCLSNYFWKSIHLSKQWERWVRQILLISEWIAFRLPTIREILPHQLANREFLNVCHRILLCVRLFFRLLMSTHWALLQSTSQVMGLIFDSTEWMCNLQHT